MTEPVLDDALVERIRARLVTTGREPTAVGVAEAMRQEHQVAGSQVLLALVDRLRSDMIGAGPLDRLLQDPDVTDVLVNGPEQVFVDRGDGPEETDVHFADDTAVRRLAQRLAASAGRRLDDAAPWVDARLVDGTRLHAVLAPLSHPGTTISLRVPARRTFTLDQLVTNQMVGADAADDLRRLVDSRLSFVVTGGTGSGKTTLLTALLALVPADERIVVVEDSTELRPRHPHVVGLEARPANVEGAGQVSVRDLVRQALRMRPDRLVVGEVRGAEVVDLLAALNTGHAGGCSTLHANSPLDVPARFEALGVAAGLPREAVHSQLAAGLAAVVHLERDRVRGRAVAQLSVLRRTGDLVEALPARTYTPSRTVDGPGLALWRSRT